MIFILAFLWRTDSMPSESEAFALLALLIFLSFFSIPFLSHSISVIDQFRAVLRRVAEVLEKEEITVLPTSNFATDGVRLVIDNASFTWEAERQESDGIDKRWQKPLEEEKHP